MSGWTLGEVTLALAVLFALHAFFLLPWARNRLLEAENAVKPNRAATFLILETSQLMCLAALVSAGFTFAILWYLTQLSGASSVNIAESINRIQAAEKLLGQARAALWLWAFVLAS